MKVLIPLLLLVAISAGGLFFLGSDKTKTSSDADMLQLGNFAYQQQRYDDALQWYTKAALQGKKEAQFQLSRMYEQGQGINQDDVLALHWMKKAANNGLAKAQFMYANMLMFGRGEEKPQPDLALAWYEKSAKQGYPNAILKLAKLYFNNKSDNDDIYISLDWAIKAQSIPATQANASLLLARLTEVILKRARNGDMQAQYNMATLYQQGKAVPQDQQKAMYWYQQSANLGYSKAQFQLASLLSQDPSTLPQSISYFTKAAQQGHHEAGYALTALLSTQKSTHNQYNEAWRWLYYGVRETNPKLLYNLAVILKKGKLGLPKDETRFVEWLTLAANHNITPAQNDIAVYSFIHHQNIKQSLNWLEAAAKAKDIKAQFNLGLLYARGESFSPSDEKALHWWKVAESNGNAKAQMMLGLFYNLGRGVGRSEHDAIAWYEKAASNNNLDALFNLAMIYLSGLGIDQDFKKASLYLKTLANKNDSEAQNIYASLFLDGKGVTYSPKTAVTWFRRAAKLGNTNAMFNLATEYRSGNGVAQDDKRAMFWYKKAAEQNFPPAQNAIGYLYAEGRGVKKDTDKAETWFLKASEGGLRLALQNINALHHQGSYSLVTLQVNTAIRSGVLTDGTIDLASWLETHQEPILSIH